MNAWLVRVAAGGVGGLAGSGVLWALQQATVRWLPNAMPRYDPDPADYLVEQLPLVLPAPIEMAATKAVQSGYGVLAGSAYGLLGSASGPWLKPGVVLGLVVWAAGYLGWLPVLGFLPPPWKQRAGRVLSPIVWHLGYGLGTSGVYQYASKFIRR